MWKFLHPASGNDANTYTTQWFADSKNWKEVRMNPVPSQFTDIVGDLKNLHKIPADSFDAVYLNRHIERLYPHEVQTALVESHRILKSDGHLVMNCTDLQAISRIIAEDHYLEPVYKSKLGEISPIDLIYGFRPALSAGHMDNAVHCTFTAKSLGMTLSNIGFQTIWLRRHPEVFTFLAIASKKFLNKAHMEDLSAKHFPIQQAFKPEKNPGAIHINQPNPPEKNTAKTEKVKTPAVSPKVSAKKNETSAGKNTAKVAVSVNAKKKSPAVSQKTTAASKKPHTQKLAGKKKK